MIAIHVLAGSAGGQAAVARPENRAAIIRVTGPATGSESAACFLRLVSQVVGGGTATYCLTDFRGEPGPNALVRVRGSITFRLPHRTLRANVLLVDRFAADGKHARQTARGKGISGGGTYVEDPPGNVRASNLVYRLP